MTTNFDWNNPYPTVRTPVFARNIVATSQPLAAQAGLRMLAAGGNAIDAIVAAASTITLTEPCSNGLGSDAFAIVWDGQKLHGLNASGTAPAAWDVDYFKRRHGGVYPLRGWDTVTVPGCVAGWAALHEKFGRLPFEQCLQPAIEYAEHGYAVSTIVKRKWDAHVEILKDQPGFAEHFLPRGRAPEYGERFVLQGAAGTLRRIAATQGRDFYEGETAAKLVAHATANGGSMSAADLAGYSVDWVDTIGMDYGGHRLHEIPPNGQGIAALIALGILKHFDIASLDPDSAESRHLQIEAMKVAFADVYAHVADLRHMKVTPAQLLDPAYLAERAKLINTAPGGQSLKVARPGTPGGQRSAFAPMPDQIEYGTSHISIVDSFGNAVAMTTTIEDAFGARQMVRGFLLNNELTDFSFAPADASGAPIANRVEPGKRPRSSMSPTLVFDKATGELLMSGGSPGGALIIHYTAKTLYGVLNWGPLPQQAINLPNFGSLNGPTVLEEKRFPAATVDALKARGHEVREATMTSGLQAITRGQAHGNKVWMGGADPRREGVVMGD